jgi:squalene-associated FAD-dependent desaturase
MTVRPSSGATNTRREVAVVGGGLAGLAAAEAMIRAYPRDFRVTVLEAKRVAGGRAGSFVEPRSGDTVDYCQHVAMGCCTNLSGLLDRCGLRGSFHPYRELAFLHPSSPPSVFAPSVSLPPPLHLLPALSGLRFLEDRHRREIRRAVWRLMRSSTPSLVGHRGGEWLRAHGQSDVSMRRFWDVILVSALGEHTDDVSMTAVRKVLLDGFAAARGASDVLVPRLPLSELVGRKLVAAIESLGAEVRTSAAVKRVAFDGDRVVGVEASDGDSAIAADHVLAAVPWHAAGRLFRDTPAESVLPLAAIEAMPSSPITGIHLWLDREITERPHAVFVDTTIQWLFRDDARRGRDSAPSGAGDRSQGCYYQVVISGSRAARQLGRQALLERVLAELREAFPEAHSARLLHSKIVTDPQAVFSVRPEVEASRPAESCVLPGLHLAGDWIQTGWPSTMEGAVISGRMAAASVCKQEGLRPPVIDAGLPRGWLARWLIRDAAGGL